MCSARGGERGLHRKTLVELKDPSLIPRNSHVGGRRDPCECPQTSI